VVAHGGDVRQRASQADESRGRGRSSSRAKPAAIVPQRRRQLLIRDDAVEAERSVNLAAPTSTLNCSSIASVRRT
jgi:hypothetical protein